MAQGLKKRGRGLLDAVTVLVIVYLATIAWGLAQHLTFINGVLLAIFGFSALKIIYELTFNRDKVPALNTGFFERRKIVSVLEKDAAGKASYTVFDLGSGGGALTRDIGRRIPQAAITGFEIAPVAYKQSLIMQKLFGPKNIIYKQQDFMTVDCASADAVVMFLTAEFAQRVGEKLYRELKPGAVVVTNEFALQNEWQPAEIITLYTPFKGTVYMYRR